MLTVFDRKVKRSFLSSRVSHSIDGREVSELVYIMRKAQTVAIARRRQRMRTGQFVRPWNAFDNRNGHIAKHGKPCRVKLFDNEANFVGEPNPYGGLPVARLERRMIEVGRAIAAVGSSAYLNKPEARCAVCGCGFNARSVAVISERHGLLTHISCANFDA